MKIDIIEKIMRFPTQTKETLTDVFGLLLGIEDRKTVDHYIRWVRAEARKIKTRDMLNLVKQTYLYAGQYSFDDFMSAMKWNRELNARFWLPAAKCWRANIFALFITYSQEAHDLSRWEWSAPC